MVLIQIPSSNMYLDQSSFRYPGLTYTLIIVLFQKIKYPSTWNQNWATKDLPPTLSALSLLHTHTHIIQTLQKFLFDNILETCF